MPEDSKSVEYDLIPRIRIWQREPQTVRGWRAHRVCLPGRGGGSDQDWGPTSDGGVAGLGDGSLYMGTRTWLWLLATGWAGDGHEIADARRMGEGECSAEVGRSYSMAGRGPRREGGEVGLPQRGGWTCSNEDMHLSALGGRKR